MIDHELGWMRMALAEAEKGRGSVEPNPMVGAVVVKQGQLVARGHHERFGGPHAEVMALREAREAASGVDALRDARAVLPPRQDPALHRRDPRRGDRPRRRRDARPVPPGGRRRTGDPPLGGGCRRAWPGGGGGGGPQRPLSQAGLHRPALRHGQVGHDARRQDRRGLGAESVDLRRRSRGPWSISSGAGWTRSSSGSAPSWPTTPCSRPALPALGPRSAS